MLRLTFTSFGAHFVFVQIDCMLHGGLKMLYLIANRIHIFLNLHRIGQTLQILNDLWACNENVRLELRLNGAQGIVLEAERNIYKLLEVCRL